MFNSVSSPGTPDIVADLFSFEGTCFRSQNATALGLVGKALSDCALIYEDAVVIGVIHTQLSASDPISDEGVACDPRRVISERDRVIFVGPSAFPILSSQNMLVQRNSVVRGGPLPQPTCTDREPYDVLVCGWREEWNTERGLFRRRIDAFTRNLPNGSRIELPNLNGHNLAGR